MRRFALDQHDPVAVDLIIEGSGVRAHTVDYWEAVRRLRMRRLSDGQIAYRIGKSRHSVWRIRSRILGMPPVIEPHAGPLPADERAPYPARPKRMG